MSEKYVKESRFLSYILRHNPASIDLKMDNEGWVNVESFIVKARDKGYQFSNAMLKDIVETDSKGRYEYSESGTYIRATQGHSIQGLDLGYQEQPPPSVLYHGTAERFFESIKKEGIKAGTRTHVHLSADTVTAMSVGARHGKPIAFVIDSKTMQLEGIKFYQSTNGVWLVGYVPPKYLHSALVFKE